MGSTEAPLTHLTFEQLADYQEGRLSQATADVVAAHLATECSHCQEEITWLSDIQATMRSDIWLQPPSTFRDITRRHYRQRYRQPERTPFFAGWLQAILGSKQQFALVGVSALLLFVTVGLALVTLTAREPGLAASVADVTGSVEVQSAGSNEWVQLQKGMELRSGDRLRSNDQSAATIGFPDDSSTDMGANTRLSIFQLRRPQSGAGQIVILHQNLGQTQNDVQPLGSADSRFEVESPSATVAVKGTSSLLKLQSCGQRWYR